MTSKKVTRRALLMSVTSLLICISMLLGTTFAWFTDEVTSGVNQIIAGNLDVDVKYSTNGTDFVDSIVGKTDIFVAPAGQTKGLWEPGHVEVAYLKVENLGTLALKYKIALAPFSETYGEAEDETEIKLSEVLKYAVVDYTGAYANRAAALAAAGTGAALNGLMGLESQDAIKLDAKGGTTDSKTVAVIVWMPETTGNEANYRGDKIPEIDFALSVVATQDTVEYDSFNQNYDLNALYPELPESTGGTVTANYVGTSATQPVTATSGDVSVTIPVNTALTYDDGGTTKDVANNTDVTLSVEFKEAAEDSVTYDISLTDAEGHHLTSDKDLTVTLKVGSGLSDVTVTHNGNPMTSSEYSYDASTGILTIMTKSFSPFVIKYKAKAISLSVSELELYPNDDGAEIKVLNIPEGAKCQWTSGSSIRAFYIGPYNSSTIRPRALNNAGEFVGTIKVVLYNKIIATLKVNIKVKDIAATVAGKEYKISEINDAIRDAISQNEVLNVYTTNGAYTLGVNESLKVKAADNRGKGNVTVNAPAATESAVYAVKSEINDGVITYSVVENGAPKVEYTDANGVKSYFDKLSITKSGTYKLLSDISQTSSVTVSGKNVTLDLNGHKLTVDDSYSAALSVRGRVDDMYNLTVTGDGEIVNNKSYCIWAKRNCNITIKNGAYSGVTHTVYAEGGTITIEGGSFKNSQTGADPNHFTLNCLDDNYKNTANIIVKGGSFYEFNPANNAAEGANTNFVADGFAVSEKDTNGYYTVSAVD